MLVGVLLAFIGAFFLIPTGKNLALWTLVFSIINAFVAVAGRLCSDSTHCIAHAPTLRLRFPCVLPPICLSCTIQWPGSGPCTSCSARNGEVHTPHVAAGVWSQAHRDCLPLHAAHWCLVDSGVIGACVAMGNLSGALLGLSYSAVGQAGLQIMVFVLFLSSTFITGTGLCAPSSSSRHWLATSN